MVPPNTRCSCSGDDPSPCNAADRTCVDKRNHLPICHSGLERQRSGRIHPSSKNNLRRVKLATWEDPSAPFHDRQDDMSGKVVPFTHTGYICSVAGGRLPPLRTHWGVVPFIRTGCICNVAGGRLPPLRTHWGVVPFIRTVYSRNVPYGFADPSGFSTIVILKPPFFDPWGQTEPRSKPQNCQLSIGK